MEQLHEVEDNNLNDENEVEEVKEEEVNIEFLNEKMEIIMQKLESLNVDREIGEREKNRDIRLMIEKIELENFKSYAGVKKIGPLHHSFNAIVGPNGSGKSNLMESLLFVFGKRAKRMRLNKLNELIHNSSTQNNLRFARVTVYFKEIKDLEDEKVEEVTNSNFILSREVYRNGSSKYFLNGKDINFDSLCDILNKKGIDLKHNRFLILQGEVEQISMMKAKATTSGEVGLLEFLEDIIGTTRYVNLIEKLSKDIDELGEIKTQKANRVKITKNELDQLEDVKNSSTEYYKKEKELHIFGHLDFLIKRHQINKQILDNQNKIQNLNNNLCDIDKKIQDKIEENSHVIDQHKKIRKEQEILKNKKNELTKMTDELEEEDKVKRADIENYSKNIAKTKTALEKLNKNYQSQSENIQNARTDLPKKEKEIKEIIEFKKNIEKYLNEKEQELFEKTEKIQLKKREVQRQIQPFEDKINQNKFQIEQNSSTINLIGQKLDRITNELNLLETKKADIEKAIEEKNNLSNQLEIKIKQLENSLQDSRNNLNKSNSELENKYRTTQNLLAKISEIRNTNQEKVNKNAILDALLRAQNEGKLSGIYGRLGDLGIIDSRYDVAVTTSCSNLDSIVVETVDHAQKCLDFLKKNNIGRGTFLILEKVAWVESKLRERFYAPNNCERLYDLIKFKNQRLAVAFYFALRDTLVAPDLKTATSVAYGVPRHRVVTINGELIEISGTMSGGGKPKRGGMSSKEMSEEYSQDYINKLNQEYENMIKEFDLAKMERNGIETRVNNVNAQLQEALILKNKTDNELVALHKAFKEVDRNLNQLKVDYDKYNKEEKKLNELKEINEDLTAKNEKLIQESSSLRNELLAIEEEIGKIGGQEFNNKKEEFKQMKKRIDILEKEIHTMKHLTENAPDILEKIKEEIIQKEKVVKEYEDMIENIKKELSEIENRGLELYAQIEVCQTQINNFDKMFLDKGKEVEELRTLIRKMKDDQEKLKSEIHEINIEIKKFEKNEKLINEDLNKNKKSFKKLVDEFGFIDEFEKEIKFLNKKNKYSNLDMMVVDGENNNDEPNSNDIDVEEEKERDFDIDNTRKIKMRKTSNNYQKYIDPKFLEYAFKIEELDELSKSVKEIAYEYTMLQTKINDMKPNMNAILLYKNKLIELKSREDDFNQTFEKLNKAKQIFDCVKTRRYNEFMEGFNIISSKLKEMYQLITNGGDAELELLDSLDPFSEGILFSVRPFKKSWKQISNLSGGEKTLSSLSLIFALHHYKPSPLYVLDEIDAALDFKNVSIIANYIKEQTKNSQFIIISLRNHMFELANRLIGIYKTYDITKCISFNPETCKLGPNDDNKNHLNASNNHNLNNF